MSVVVREGGSLARNKFLFSREALECLKRVFDAHRSVNTCNLATLIDAVIEDSALPIIVGKKRAEQIVDAVIELDHPNAATEYVTHETILHRLNIEVPVRPVTPHPTPYQLSLAEFHKRLHSVMKSDYASVPAVLDTSPSHSTFKEIAQRLERLTTILTPSPNIEELTKRIDQRMEEEKMDVVDESAGERQERLLQERLHTLSPEEESVVSKLFSPPYTSAIIIDKFNIDMNKNKLRCLMPSTWLNDEVINFYMCMLQERDAALVAANPNRRPSHYFNSFFVHKLVDADNRYNFNNIKR